MVDNAGDSGLRVDNTGCFRVDNTGCFRVDNCCCFRVDNTGCLGLTLPVFQV